VIRDKKERSGGRIAPGYEKIRQWILDYIRQNELGPGDRVPSYRAISGQLGVNPALIAKAVSELVDEGVLKRERGNGTFVTECMTQQERKSTRSIGIIMPVLGLGTGGDVVGTLTTGHLPEPFTRTNVGTDIAIGISSVLRELGYRFVVYTNHSTQEQAVVLDNLLSEGLDGVIAMPTGTEESAVRYAQLMQAGLPFVFADRYFPEVPIDRVVTDNRGGAKNAVRDLISRGHRRIAYFTNFTMLTSVLEREEGYRAALEEAGIPFEESLVFGPTLVRNMHYTYEFALERCLRMSPPVTAVFGMNDDMVWAAMQAADKLGVAVPDDMEVAGFSIPLFRAVLRCRSCVSCRTSLKWARSRRDCC
jgi:GntR family transcriptional regulator, arabinose operon transcriptional repressor